MATRGRKPKPTELKLLEGNPAKRPLNKNEPNPEKKAPRCPTGTNPLIYFGDLKFPKPSNLVRRHITVINSLKYSFTAYVEIVGDSGH